ncbi:MAG: histidine phosphatase family protein [Bacteroidota bacterium]|nr:histidine phosphatase family protein [Bacteroidota bacterium]
MKTLYLARHAKSDWGNEVLKDIDRPLNNRGYSDAYIQSVKFSTDQKHPDLIISSPAVRAFTTAGIFARTLKYREDKIILSPELYEASTGAVIHTIAATNNAVSTLMVFGHNPSFTEVFDEISDSYIDNIPTCGIIGVSFKIKSWAEIITTKGHCFLSFFPKDFKQ